ncbi:MAG: hypothetical protein R6T90_10470 [Dissulfuribacterales bacterium]|jgi:hypothetical protein|nr:hypothetical protein [Deltaproteobacteria bacterium]
MKAKIENNKLYIEIEINKEPVPSASGKTSIVASTRGNIVTDVMVDGKPLTIGLNAYIKR